MRDDDGKDDDTENDAEIDDGAVPEKKIAANDINDALASATYAENIIEKKAAAFEKKAEDSKVAEPEKPAEPEEPPTPAAEHEPYQREETFKGIHEELSWMNIPERDEPYQPDEDGFPYLLDEELFYDYVLT